MHANRTSALNGNVAPSLPMNIICSTAFVATCLLSGAACAQSANQPLNLQLPPGGVPAAASTVSSHPTPHPVMDAHGNPTSPPGVYYGDTSGRVYPASARSSATQRCDDSTFNQPQVHGSASMGVMGGNHVSGNYQAATINMTENLGDCEHPSGGIGLSIWVGQSRFHGHRW